MSISHDTSQPDESRSTGPLGAALVLIAAIVTVTVVIVCGLHVARTPTMTALDLRADQALNAFHTGATGVVAALVYRVFSPVPAILLALVVAVIIWVRTRRLVTASTFAATIALTWIPSDVVKDIVARPRPRIADFAHHFAFQPSDPSYPSGHMVFITALVVSLFLLAPRPLSRRIIGWVGASLIAVVAGSLLIDAVHYPSDVVASIVWGLGVAPAAHLIWRRFVITRLSPLRRRAGRLTGA